MIVKRDCEWEAELPVRAGLPISVGKIDGRAWNALYGTFEVLSKLRGGLGARFVDIRYLVGPLRSSRILRVPSRR